MSRSEQILLRENSVRRRILAETILQHELIDDQYDAGTHPLHAQGRCESSQAVNGNRERKTWIGLRKKRNVPSMKQKFNVRLFFCFIISANIDSVVRRSKQSMAKNGPVPSEDIFSFRSYWSFQGGQNVDRTWLSGIRTLVRHGSRLEAASPMYLLRCRYRDTDQKIHTTSSSIEKKKELIVTYR